MKAGVYHLEMEQGSTYRAVFTLSDTTLNLTAYDKIRMKIRRTPGGSVVWNSEAADPGGSIEIQDSTTIVLLIDSDTTAGFQFDEAGYDIELVISTTTPETVDKILKGKIILDKEYTK